MDGQCEAARLAGQLHAGPPVLLNHRAADEVHRRRADKARHEQVGWTVVDFLRAAELAYLAILHHGNQRAERHGLDLIVRHVHDAGLEPLVQLFDLVPHLYPELGIEIGQRLVEQEQSRIACDRPAHGYALTLPARELARFAVEQLIHLQNLGHAADDLGLLVLGYLAHFQSEGNVLPHGHGRVQSIGLEHHRNIAILRAQIVHHATADPDFARRGGIESRDHIEQSGFSAARRSNQDQELAGLDLDVDPLEHLHRAVGLGDVLDRQRRHTLLLS